MLVVLASGCRPYPAFAPPTPEQRNVLDRLVSDDPTNVDAVSQLAVTQLLEGEFAQARAVLEDAAALVPGDPVLPVLLALANEAAGDDSEAANLYEAYAHVGPLADLAMARLEAARPRAYRERARRVLSGESAALWSEDARRVVVMPFAHPEADEYGVATSIVLQTLVSQDLARRRLAPVEPQHVRIFLDEMGVSQQRFADSATGAEVGRSFGAGLVVQGALIGVGTDSTGFDLSLTWIDAGSEGQDSVTRIHMPTALSSAGEAGRRVSTFVMQLVEGRPQTASSFGPVVTADSMATLFTGRSARALDAGDPRAARTFAQEAVTVDPGFRLAADLLARAELASSAEERSFEATVLEALRLGGLQRSIMTVRAAPRSTHRASLSQVGRRDRVLASDLLGLDRMVPGTLLEIRFGGTP